MATAVEKLVLAKKHLRKVEVAWDPPDWADLSLYGFYCLEAAIDAAAIHVGRQVRAQHWDRVNAAGALHADHGLPHVAELLRDLNEVRKSEAYGDLEAPELDAEEVVHALEAYVDAVSRLVEPDNEEDE